MFVMRLPSVFDHPDWLTLPFASQGKTTLDLILDIITKTSAITFRIDRLKECPSCFETHNEHEDIIAETLLLKKELDDLWETLGPGPAHCGWEGRYYNGVLGFDVQYDNSGLNDSGFNDSGFNDSGLSPAYLDRDTPTPTLRVQVPPPIPLCDNAHLIHTPDCAHPRLSFLPALPKGPSSRNIAFYSTARLIILSLLAQLGAPPDFMNEQMEAHSACILAVCRMMSKMKIGYALLRLVFPLHVVGDLSPVPAQRVEARAILSHWKKTEGVGGICDVAIMTLGEVSLSDLQEDDGENGYVVDVSPNPREKWLLFLWEHLDTRAAEPRGCQTSRMLRSSCLTELPPSLSTLYYIMLTICSGWLRKRKILLTRR